MMGMRSIDDWACVVVVGTVDSEVGEVGGLLDPLPGSVTIGVGEGGEVGGVGPIAIAKSVM